MNEKQGLMVKDVAAAALLLLAVGTAVSAQRAAKGVGRANPEAVAYHGAMQLYRTLAVHFGKRAMLAEQAYWKAVAQ